MYGQVYYSTGTQTNLIGNTLSKKTITYQFNGTSVFCILGMCVIHMWTYYVFRVGRHIVFPRASVCHKSIHETLYKYQSAWDDMQSARMVTLPFILLRYFPLNFVHHKNRVRSITWKPHKLYSRNFIQISMSMIWRAECKNGNSAFYTFWVISLGTLCITKIVSTL